MQDVPTANARYVYLDVVQFTLGRSVEAQTAIIDALNDMVRRVLALHELAPSQRILIPTGDGLCIALIDPSQAYDLHVRLALNLLMELARHQAENEGTNRRFEVRIGISQNIDNLITDINGHTNLAGDGISSAQRVMDLADGGQILLSESGAAPLLQRERYIGKLQRFRGSVKHGRTVTVYQYRDPEESFLNSAAPISLQTPSRTAKKLNGIPAWYVGLAIKYADVLVAHVEDNLGNEAAVVLLYLLAADHDDQARATATRPVRFTRAHGWPNLPFADQLAFYRDQDYALISEFASELIRHLTDFGECFEIGIPGYRFVTARGRERLAAESPEVAEALGLTDLPAHT